MSEGRAEDDDVQLGRCRFCGDGVWPEMEHVVAAGDHYHRGCAERLAVELERVL